MERSKGQREGGASRRGQGVAGLESRGQRGGGASHRAGVRYVAEWRHCWVQVGERSPERGRS